MTTSYRGHEYSGRENGLMVIASVPALQELGANLSQLKEPPSARDADSPAQVTSITLGSSERPYNLSFHVEGGSGRPRSNVPSDGRAFWILLAMAPFALIGLFTIAKWVFGAF